MKPKNDLARLARTMRKVSDDAILSEIQRRGLILPSGELASRRAVHDRAGCRGIYDFSLYGPDGRLKDRRVKHNLVVNAGLNWLREYAFDSVTPTTLARMSHIAIGTGAVAEAAGNTTLGTESARQVFTASTGYVAGGTGVVTVLTTFAAGTGTGAVTEAGVFNHATVGQMWNRVTFAAVNKAAGDTLKVTVTITFTAA